MATSTTIPNNDPASNLTPNIPGTTSTTAPTGIIAGAQGAPAPKIAGAADVSTAYQSLFGRPAESAGVDFWSRAAASNGWDSDQLKQAIYNGAQTDDIAAERALNGSGSLSSNWDTGLNVGDVGTGTHWNSTTNKWEATTPPAPAPGPASYTPTMLGDPTKWNVTSDQTVQGQMKNLIDPNNPYYQQWATAGAQDAAARGFTGNSSIRSTGILDSVMRGATPVATSDATTYAKAAGYNADEANQFDIANQNAANTAGAFNAGQANAFNSSKYSTDKSASTQLGVTDKNNATALAQSQLSAETQKYVADQSSATQQAIAKMNTQSQATISAAHDANANLIQSNQQAQAAYNSYVAAVAQIDQNDKMDSYAKAAAIATQTQIFNASVAGLKQGTSGTSDIGSPLDISAPAQQVGGVDVSQFLNF